MTNSPPGIHSMSGWGGSVAGTVARPGADLAVASIDELMLRLVGMRPARGATRRVARGEKATAREAHAPLVGCTGPTPGGRGRNDRNPSRLERWDLRPTGCPRPVLSSHDPNCQFLSSSFA